MRSAHAVAVAGGVALAACAVLPWIRVDGLALDLDLLGTRVPAVGATVSGTDTDAGIPLIAVGGLAVVLGTRLGASRIARLLAGLIGVVALAGGAGLAYYAWNLVDIELAGEPAAVRVAADAVIDARPREGLAVMAAAGVALVLSAVRGPAKERAAPG